MILRGSQRKNAVQIAQHLLKTEENEHVEVHGIKGFSSTNIGDALNEAETISRGTKCSQFMFSVSLRFKDQRYIKLIINNAPIGLRRFEASKDQHTHQVYDFKIRQEQVSGRKFR